MIEIRVDTVEEFAAVVAVIRGEGHTIEQIRQQIQRLNTAAERLAAAEADQPSAKTGA